MKNIAKTLALVIGTVFATAAFTLGALDGIRGTATTVTTTDHTTTVQTVDDVTSFNDGYAEAMQEAEKNGPAYVHEWNMKIQSGTVAK